jgi:corrinoid protein of di/trimethylamine methyltransferase
MSQRLEAIKQTVVNGKHKEIETLVENAIAEGIDLNRIINDALIAAMDVVGERFSTGQIFVPEMLVSALAMKKGLDVIKPRLKADQTQQKATILMGTVKGDLHDIGKNLVIMVLEGAGFHVIDLGVDLSVEKVIREVESVRPHILGLSALLTTTVPEIERVIEALIERNLREMVKVMVGGAPIDENFAREAGADGYGKDAAEAVQLARKFVAEQC